jgi:hypothetical protein
VQAAALDDIAITLLKAGRREDALAIARRVLVGRRDWTLHALAVELGRAGSPRDALDLTTDIGSPMARGSALVGIATALPR